MKTRTKKIALTALMSALTAVFTLVSVPLPGGGYYNFGDAAIFVAAASLGPITGALVGGLGGALGDLILGYTIYAPFTLVIKAAEGLLSGILYRLFKRVFVKEGGAVKKTVFSALSNVVGGLIMAAGYFLAEGLLLAEGRWQGGLVNLPWNILQGTVSAIIAPLLLFVCRLDRLFERAICPSAKRSDKENGEEKEHKDESGNEANNG